MMQPTVLLLRPRQPVLPARPRARPAGPETILLALRRPDSQLPEPAPSVRVLPWARPLAPPETRISGIKSVSCSGLGLTSL
jgi:hypothetical protein